MRRFSNKTDWTLRKVYEEDHALLEENFRSYINGFSKNVDDIIEHFNYRATIGTDGKEQPARANPESIQGTRNSARTSSPVWRWATSTRNCSGVSRNKAARELESISRRVKLFVSWSSCWRFPSRKSICSFTTLCVETMARCQWP